MSMIIKRGLNIPMAGAPEQRIDEAPPISRIALLGADYGGVRPRLAVEAGQNLAAGDLLWTDKNRPAIRFCTPLAGTVESVVRGPRRRLDAVVLQVPGTHRPQPQHEPWDDAQISRAERTQIAQHLLQNGLWPALRQRPYSKIPDPEQTPSAIFVNAMDTSPLAADPEVVLGRYADDFARGLRALARLTAGPVHVCTAPGLSLQMPDPDETGGRIRHHTFEGPHPAGLVGTHIHFLHPVGSRRTVWHLNYQDCISCGRLFGTGAPWAHRIIALSGPRVQNPRLLRTPMGADLGQLTGGQLADTADAPAEERDNRIISGSVLCGRAALGELAFLGRYSLQVSVLAEGRSRPLLHYLRAGFNRYSALPIYMSRLLGRRRKWPLTTTSNGSPRAMVPIAAYERVMPLDILPTQLLRAILVGDSERARALGCLELDEEDLALCSFICPGKHDFGPLLRQTLQTIEEEG